MQRAMGCCHTIGCCSEAQHALRQGTLHRLYHDLAPGSGLRKPVSGQLPHSLASTRSRSVGTVLRWHTTSAVLH